MRKNRTKWHFLDDNNEPVPSTGTVRVLCGKTVDVTRVHVKYGPSIFDDDRELECSDCHTVYARRIARPQRL